MLYDLYFKKLELFFLKKFNSIILLFDASDRKKKIEKIKSQFEIIILIAMQPAINLIVYKELKKIKSTKLIFFIINVYIKLNKKYTLTIIKKSLFIKKYANKSLDITKIAIKIIQYFIGISNAAIGLLDFKGCFLSVSLSIISLVKYPADDIKLNDIKPNRD